MLLIGPEIPEPEVVRPFQFLLKTVEGARLFPFTVLAKDAERLLDIFGQLKALDGDPFVSFRTSDGRLVIMNRAFIVGVSVIEVACRRSDYSEDTLQRPDLMLFIEGLEDPITIEEMDREQRDYVATVLQDWPETQLVNFPDDENVKTRFIATRSIILMDARDPESPDADEENEGDGEYSDADVTATQSPP